MAKPKKHNRAAYKSGLESRFQAAAAAEGWNLPYEQDKIKYEIPASNHTYTPDFTTTHPSLSIIRLKFVHCHA
mgnify:CR=1 FL=1